MEFFNTIRMILGIGLFAGMGLNFVYQAFRAFKKLRAINYSEQTIHQFKCGNCDEVYEISGANYQSKVSIWSPKMEKRTPRSQSTAIRFECPLCFEKAFQEKIYDTNRTAGLGSIRAQFDESSREVLLELLLKGFLPFVIGMPILGLLL